MNFFFNKTIKCSMGLASRSIPQGRQIRLAGHLSNEILLEPDEPAEGLTYVLMSDPIAMYEPKERIARV